MKHIDTYACTLLNYGQEQNGLHAISTVSFQSSGITQDIIPVISHVKKLNHIKVKGISQSHRAILC